MDRSTVAVVIVVVVLALLVIRAAYVLYNNKDKYIELAKEYVEKYSDFIKQTLIECIENIDVDLTEITSLDDLKKLVSKETFSDIWEAIYETWAKEAVNLKEITEDVFSSITTTLVEDVIDEFVNNDEEVVAASNNKMAEIAVAAAARTQKREEELKAKADMYETETAPFEEVPEMDIHAVPDDVELNPQTDEEGPYDENDDSQEIVKEDNE